MHTCKCIINVKLKGENVGMLLNSGVLCFSIPQMCNQYFINTFNFYGTFPEPKVTNYTNIPHMHKVQFTDQKL